MLGVATLLFHVSLLALGTGLYTTFAKKPLWIRASFASDGWPRPAQRIWAVGIGLLTAVAGWVGVAAAGRVINAFFP